MTKKIIKTLIMVLFVIFVGLIGFYFLFPGPSYNLTLKLERSAGNLEQSSIHVNGLRFEYLEGGKGETLVLIHGFGANKDNWTRIGKHLTPYFRVIAPDLPGFGETSLAANDEYTIDIQAERIKAFIEALGIRDLHIGGSSMGGQYCRDLRLDVS